MLKKFFVCFLFIVFISTCVGCIDSGSKKEVVCCELEISYDNDVIVGKVTYSNFCHLVKDNSLIFNLYPNKQKQKSGQITPLTALLNDSEINFELQGDNCEYLLLKANFKDGDRLQINFRTVVEEGDGRLSKNGEIVNLAYFYPQLCAIFEDEVSKYAYIAPSMIMFSIYSV